MKRVITWILLIAFVLSGLAAAVLAETSEPAAIKIAPPAPKFTDAERQSELARRRSEVAKRMSPNSVLVLWSAEPRNYAGDVDFYYRQENNLYYLTNLKQGNATLVIAKNGDNVREFLFIPKRNPQFETWNGKMYSNEDASRISGVKTVIDSTEQTVFLTAVGKKETFTSKSGVNIAAGESLYLLLTNADADRDSFGPAEYNRENDFSKTAAGYKVVNARPIFDELRLIKSPYELKILQHAIDITTEAQMHSMAMVGRAKMEYEVHAEVEYTFRRRNADYWGYPSIVGCGPNATTLHYVESQGEVKKGDLMLMDVGAEYDHYTADVTRTYPVNGKFSKEQAEIYQIVYDAQDAVAAVVKPGAKIMDVERASVAAVKAGLAKLGLITSPDATFDAMVDGEMIKISQHRLWFMHGNSHWLGMNVHDVGEYSLVPRSEISEKDAYKYSTPLKPGMVFTNEPGVYLREDALDYLLDTPGNKAFLAKVRPVYEKYRGIGVRIEDDLLVTASGVEWMTKALPRTIADIEAFMAKAPKQFAYTAANTPNMLTNQSVGGKYPLIFTSHNYPTGVSMRSGFIGSGGYAANFGFSHTSHSHTD